MPQTQPAARNTAAAIDTRRVIADYPDFIREALACADIFRDMGIPRTQIIFTVGKPKGEEITCAFLRVGPKHNPYWHPAGVTAPFKDADAIALWNSIADRLGLPSTHPDHLTTADRTANYENSYGYERITYLAEQLRLRGLKK